MKKGHTGDEGETAVIDEYSVEKSDQLIEVLGEADELNSFVGLASSLIKDPEVKAVLRRIQSDIFVLCTDVQLPISSKRRKSLKLIEEGNVRFIEDTIRFYEQRLEPLRNFIYPSGCLEASILHVCRTVSRRVERALAKLAFKREVSKHAYRYINRLSDLFFVLARYLNKEAGISDEVWKL